MFGIRFVNGADLVLFAGGLSIVAASVCGTPAQAGESGRIRIVTIGDSTVCDYDPAKTNIRGWGQLLPEFFDPAKVEIINLARSGRSSKSFLTEGHWDKVLALSPAPNYVLIQFAHNDDLSKGPDRATLPGKVPAKLPAEGFGSDPKDWYRNNLRTYIEQARKTGAVPVLVTSMERRQFRGKVPARKNLPCAEAAKEMGEQEDVMVVDLEAFSFGLYSEQGMDNVERMHFHRDDLSVDNSHYNGIGARIWAEFIAGQLAKHVPELKPLMESPATFSLNALKVASDESHEVLNNDDLETSPSPMGTLFTKEFLAETKARFPMDGNISFPQSGWDRIHYAQVFQRNVITDGDLEALAKERDLVWGAKLGLVEKGGYGSSYYPSHRDFDQSRVFPGGSPVVRDLEWYQKNQPEWVVYQADKKTPAYGFVYEWGGYMGLDITRQDVREYILNTFLVPAIDRGWSCIAFDNVALDNQHKRVGVYHNGKWVQLYSGERRDSVYAEDMMDYLLWVKREVNVRGVPLMLNGKVDPQRPERTWELVASADIWFDEGAFSNHAKKKVVDKSWELRYVISSMKAADGYYVGANSTGVEFEEIPDDEIDWILANFLLVRGKNSFLSITGDRYTGYLLSYPPSFDPPVGLPQSDSYKKGELYMRNYENGFIAVNPSSKASLSFTPPSGCWEDRLGNIIGDKIVLTPRSGTVLLKVKN